MLLAPPQKTFRCVAVIAVAYDDVSEFWEWPLSDAMAVTGLQQASTHHLSGQLTVTAQRDRARETSRKPQTTLFCHET
jgi:hypothetical protein